MKYRVEEGGDLKAQTSRPPALVADEECACIDVEKSQSKKGISLVRNQFRIWGCALSGSPNICKGLAHPQGVTKDESMAPKTKFQS